MITSAEMRPLSEWPSALEAAARRTTRFREVVVLKETASTQDHARQLGAGAIVAAWRQTAGRGRLGRAWLDTGEDGLAITFNAPNCRAALASIMAGVAAADAVEEACRESGRGTPAVGIKWPNDLMVAGGKLGGVLVEAQSGFHSIGIGINCRQREFPAILQGRATSLAMLGLAVDRLAVAVHLIGAIDRWLGTHDDRVIDGFAARDTLKGRAHKFRTPQGIVEGVAIRVDPARGMIVRTSRGDIFLPAGTSSLFVEDDRS